MRLQLHAKRLDTPIACLLLLIERVEPFVQTGGRRARRVHRAIHVLRRGELRNCGRIRHIIVGCLLVTKSTHGRHFWWRQQVGNQITVRRLLECIATERVHLTRIVIVVHIIVRGASRRRHVDVDVRPRTRLGRLLIAVRVRQRRGGLLRRGHLLLVVRR